MGESINGSKYTTFQSNVGVKFLEGTQSKLNTLMASGGATEGAFYLTRDTQRLYIGRKTTETPSKIVPVPVNPGVTTVTSLSDLERIKSANVGDFYYVEDDNILCVCRDTDGEGAQRVCYWTQLNTDTQLKGYDVEVTGSSNTATISHTIEDTNDTYEADWTLVGSNNVTISVADVGTAPVHSYQVTIAAVDTTYTLAPAAGTTGQANLVLTPNSGTAQTVKFAGTRISFSASGDTITATGQEIDGLYDTHANGTPGWKIGINVDGGQNGSEATINPTIRYGQSATDGTSTGNYTDSKTFSNEIATLDVYTTTETRAEIARQITNSVRNLNGITFRGKIDEYSDIPVQSSNVQVGDAYKAIDDIVIPSDDLPIFDESYINAGDLIIATGTELGTGYIGNNTLRWVIIPSGDEDAYSVSAQTHGIHIVKGATAIGGIILANTDGFITLDDNVSAGQVNTITLTHKTVSVSRTSGTAVEMTGGGHSGSTPNDESLTFWVPDEISSGVVGVNADACGHVTAVKMKQVTVKDTHNYLVTVTNTATTLAANDTYYPSKGAKVDTKYTDADDQELTSTVNYISDKSTIKITSGTVTGGGAAVNFDILWGSFE